MMRHEEDSGTKVRRPFVATPSYKELSMTQAKWIEHAIESGHNKPEARAERETCPECAARRRTLRAARSARARRQAYADLGMVRVRGSLGGTYYE
jgi:hypothetical protein